MVVFYFDAQWRAHAAAPMVAGRGPAISPCLGTPGVIFSTPTASAASTSAPSAHHLFVPRTAVAPGEASRTVVTAFLLKREAPSPCRATNRELSSYPSQAPHAASAKLALPRSGATLPEAAWTAEQDRTRQGTIRHVTAEPTRPPSRLDCHQAGPASTSNGRGRQRRVASPGCHERTELKSPDGNGAIRRAFVACGVSEKAPMNGGPVPRRPFGSLSPRWRKNSRRYGRIFCEE